MGVGHAAVALGASRRAPRINAGILIFAAFLADFLLGIFGALGMDRRVCRRISQLVPYCFAAKIPPVWLSLYLV
jgi:hypothetical protein